MSGCFTLLIIIRGDKKREIDFQKRTVSYISLHCSITPLYSAHISYFILISQSLVPHCKSNNTFHIYLAILTNRSASPGIIPIIRMRGDEVWWCNSYDPSTSHGDHDESPIDSRVLDEQPEAITIDAYGDLHLVAGTSECVFLTYNTASGRRIIRLRKERRPCGVPLRRAYQIFHLWMLSRGKCLALWARICRAPRAYGWWSQRCDMRGVTRDSIGTG